MVTVKLAPCITYSRPSGSRNSNFLNSFYRINTKDVLLRLPRLLGTYFYLYLLKIVGRETVLAREERGTFASSVSMFQN